MPVDGDSPLLRERRPYHPETIDPGFYFRKSGTGSVGANLHIEIAFGTDQLAHEDHIDGHSAAQRTGSASGKFVTPVFEKALSTDWGADPGQSAARRGCSGFNGQRHRRP